MRRRDGGAGRRRAWRCASKSGGGSDPAGAAPAGEPRKLAPGRLRDPTWGYYGPCARSSLTARVHRRARKRGPELRHRSKGDAESRSRAPKGATAGVSGRHLRRSGDGPDREAGHGCGVSAPAPVGALLPSFFEGSGNGRRASGAPPRTGRRSFAWFNARHSGAEQSEEPGIHNAGQENGTPAERYGQCRGYGFRARRVRAVPE